MSHSEFFRSARRSLLLNSGSKKMTRRTFYRQLQLVSLGLVVWAAMRFVVGYYDETLSKALDASTPPLLGVVALYAGSLFQRRFSFIDNLRKEWVEIVEAKTDLIMFCKSPSHEAKEAIEAWGRLSVVIDRMRVIYRNVHESKSRLGYYPYEPLHDMRKDWEEKILKCLTKLSQYDEIYYNRTENDIIDSFQAIREVFIDELDLEAPTNPIVEQGARRRKQEGAEVTPTKQKSFQV